MKGLLLITVLLLKTVAMVIGCGRSRGPPADGTKPKIECPPDIEVYADPFQVHTKVTWSENNVNVFDERDGNIEWRRTGLGPGYIYSEGTSKNTYSGRDNSGNYASCEMKIVVKVLTCPKWGKIEDGWKQCHVSHNSRRVRRGSVCDFGCYRGHKLVGASTAKCLDSQKWDISSQPYCERLQCTPLFPSQDQYDLVDIVCTDGNYFRSQCSYNCVPGYSILPGHSKVQICDEFGSWLGNKPKCVDSEPPTYITCPYVVTGYAERSKTSGRVWWDTPEAKDNSGHVTTIQLTNIKSGTDLEVGEYNVAYMSYDAVNNKAICAFKVVVKQIKCHTIYPLPYTNVMCPEGRIYGSKCEFTCDNHTSINGDRLAECDKKGSTIQYGIWSFDNNQPYCELQETCPALQPPDNGALACDSWFAGKYCQMLCQDGYVVTDEEKINMHKQLLVCSDSNTWLNTKNVELPPCEKKDERTRMFYVINIHYLYYSGNCKENLDQIKLNFIARIKKLNIECDPDNCNTKNVQVTCGTRTRKKKSATNHDVLNGLSLSYNLELNINISSTEALLKKQAIRNSLKEAVVNGDFNLPGHENDSISLELGGPYGTCNEGSVLDEKTLLCVECTAGRYFDTSSQNCVRCPRGQYQPLSRQTECIDCPIGTTTTYIGATSEMQCEDACEAGYYSKTGVQPCTACDHGTYSTTYGSMSCIKCPGSKITLKSASTNITECKDFDITYMPLNTTDTIIPAVLTQQNITSLDNMTVELWVKCTSCDNILNITGEDDAPILSIEGIDQLEITWLGTIYKTGECINGVDTWKKITLNTTDGFISVYIDDIKLITEANTSLSMSNSVNITVGGDGFIGSISQVNMWSADYIRSFTPTNTCFIESPGNLIAWQQFSETDGTFVLTQSQCDAFDNCKSMPCQNDGVCSDKIDGFTCNCTDGFDGTTCEINIDDCIDKMCDNGGTCVDDINKSTCLCPQGYTGELCEYQYVDGGWTDWVESGGCSVTCGNGTKLMSRACENPEPLYTGKECEGDNFQIVECATNIKCIEDCKTDPSIKNGSANCSWTDDSNITRVCYPYCDEGYDFSSLLFIETSGIKCGPETGNTWNFRTTDYPSAELPSCTLKSKALKNELMIQNGYPTLNYTDLSPELANEIETVIDNKINVTGCVGTGRCLHEVRVKMSDDDNDVSRIRRDIDRVEFTINLTCEVINDMDECYDLLYDLVQEINSMITQLQFTVQSGGLDHNVEVNGSTYDGISTCMPGFIPVWQYCIPCGIGTYAYNGYCEVCPVGTYQDLEGQLSCKQCPEDWSTAGLMTRDVKHCNVYIEPSKALLIGLVVGLFLLALAIFVLAYIVYKKLHKLYQVKCPSNAGKLETDNAISEWHPDTIHSTVKKSDIPSVELLHCNPLYEESQLRTRTPPQNIEQK